MVGLLIKDIRLLLGQTRFFLAVVMLSVVFVFSGQDPMFVVSYSTMLCAFFTISTISYDEYNHGFLFLFTLPISRKGYVLGKYLFGVLVGGSAWLATTMLGACYHSITNAQFSVTEWIGAAAATLFVLGCFLCVTLPLQFKFGAEKSRTALFIIMIVIFGLIGIFLKADGLADRVYEKLEWMQSLNGMLAFLLGLFVFAGVAVISILISIHIVEKKEF